MGRRPSARTPARLSRTRPTRHKVTLEIVLVSLLLTLTPGKAWAAPPANDDFDNASVVSSLPFSDSLNTTEATTSGDDPTCAGKTVGYSLWYRITPDQNMEIRANTFGSNYDTLLGIYTGSRESLNEMVCNDDSAGYQSSVQFNALGGETYFLMVGNGFGPPGDLVFSMEGFPAPANDDFDGAIVVDQIPFLHTVDTRGATTAGDDPISSCANNNSVWYAFTPVEDIAILPTDTGSDYQAAISIYTGTRGSLSLRACDFGSSFEYVALTGGTTYFFMVGAVSGEGDLVFSIDRVRLETNLQLVVSRSRVTYNRSVTVRAHLDAFAEATNRVVNVYKTPYGGTKTLVLSGEIDASGNLLVPVTMKKKTVFVAEWAGDENFLPATSNTKTVLVRVITKTKLSGHYGTSGRYKLYHAGDDPKQTGTVIPNHAGKRLDFVAQVWVGGSWVTIATARPRIRSNGSVSLRLIDPPPGYNYRARNGFDGDRDHLGDTSSWKYFRVTS
jgi:hypothetical protein